MVKSHISVANTLTRVIVPIANKRPVKLETCQKHGQSSIAKDKNLRKRKVVSLRESLEAKSPEEEDFNQRAIANDETQIKTTEQLNPPDTAARVDMIYGTFEISVNYLDIGEILH